jgi:hypothetical protein
MLENKQMLFEILENPDGILDAVRRYTNSLTTAMTFGYVFLQRKYYIPDIV